MENNPDYEAVEKEVRELNLKYLALQSKIAEKENNIRLWRKRIQKQDEEKERLLIRHAELKARAKNEKDQKFALATV